MADGCEEIIRIIQKPGVPRQIYINRTEMSLEELQRSMAERDELIRGMAQGGAPLLNGMEKLFGDIDPELKEAIERARRMGRLG